MKLKLVVMSEASASPHSAQRSNLSAIEAIAVKVWPERHHSGSLNGADPGAVYAASVHPGFVAAVRRQPQRLAGGGAPVICALCHRLATGSRSEAGDVPVPRCAHPTVPPPARHVGRTPLARMLPRSSGRRLGGRVLMPCTKVAHRGQRTASEPMRLLLFAPQSP